MCHVYQTQISTTISFSVGQSFRFSKMLCQWLITLQSSSSKEMKHTQGSRNVIPSSHCIMFSRYQIYWDMRWVVKSRPYGQHLLNISAKIMGSGGAKSMVQVRISQLNALTKSPAPTHTLTLVALATDKCGFFFFLMKRMHRNKNRFTRGWYRLRTELPSAENTQLCCFK